VPWAKGEDKGKKVVLAVGDEILTRERRRVPFLKGKIEWGVEIGERTSRRRGEFRHLLQRKQSATRALTDDATGGGGKGDVASQTERGGILPDQRGTSIKCL